MMHNIYLLTIAFIVFSFNSIVHGSCYRGPIDRELVYLNVLNELFNQNKDAITENYFSVQSEERIEIIEDAYIPDHQKSINQVVERQQNQDEQKEKDDPKTIAINEALIRGDKDMISGIEKAIGGIITIAKGIKTYNKGADGNRLSVDVAKGSTTVFTGLGQVLHAFHKTCDTLDKMKYPLIFVPHINIVFGLVADIAGLFVEGETSEHGQIMDQFQRIDGKLGNLSIDIKLVKQQVIEQGNIIYNQISEMYTNLTLYMA
eukprot:48464_1